MTFQIRPSRQFKNTSVDIRFFILYDDFRVINYAQIIKGVDRHASQEKSKKTNNKKESC